jgi:hypothetical protein
VVTTSELDRAVTEVGDLLRADVSAMVERGLEQMRSAWMFAYFDWATLRMTEVYEQERDLLVRDRERRKRKLVRDLLDGVAVDAEELRYREGSVAERLAELAPDGIDVYVDSVGGDHLQAAIGHAQPWPRRARGSDQHVQRHGARPGAGQPVKRKLPVGFPAAPCPTASRTSWSASARARVRRRRCIWSGTRGGPRA